MPDLPRLVHLRVRLTLSENGIRLTLTQSPKRVRMPKLSISPRRTLPIIALVALASVAFFSASTVTVAQQSPAPAQHPASPDQKSDDSQQPTETLKVNVNVVQLFFNVKDKHGALIPNLTKERF